MRSPSAPWVEPQPLEVPQALLDFTGEPCLIAELLMRRGITTPAQVRAFFDPRAYTPTAAGELPDLEKGAQRITRAIQQQERIGIWGDFDVDGQTATTLLYSTLKDLGANVTYHIPVRARESHGVNLVHLEQMLQDGVQVVLTCDTGITAHEAVDFAAQQHVDFVITDHHTLPDALPRACAVVNPQRLPQNHPLNSLPGVGTAYKFAEELYRLAGRPSDVLQYTDLVALGTVADVARLSGDSRYLVQLGLEQLRLNQRLGLQVLYELAEINPAQINEEHIGFAIAPRLNAIGRLDDSNPIVEWLTTSNEAFARRIATHLEGLNAHRKLLCDQVFQGALAQIQQNPAFLEDPVLLLMHAQWPGGVVGIAASRLVELYQRPVILLTTPPGQTARGSARSVDGINITAAISENQQWLLGFGGHPMAAGMSIAPENITEFRRGLIRSITRMTKDQPASIQLNIDAYLDFDQLTLDLVEKMDQLAPFGAGNPPIVLATRNLILRESSLLGKNRDHLQALVEDPAGNTRRVIWWQGAGSPLPDGRFDLAYTARASNFRGQVSLSLEWIGARWVSESIEVPSKKQLELIDARFEIEPGQAIAAYLDQPGVMIWREGESASTLQGADRYHLQPAHTLVIYNLPPGHTELHAVLQAVNPQRVVLLAVPSGSDQPQAFLQRLSGLIRYAIRAQAGWVTLAGLAGACGQREITVRLGVDWLVAKGVFCQPRQEDEKTQLAEGGLLDTARVNEIEPKLKAILQETAAFRAFYLRATPQQILAQ